jgi:glutamate-1-semialdehyde 2,1-aminomutase
MKTKHPTDWTPNEQIRIPGYWSPTDPNRAAIDGPKGQDLWRRADKVLPSKAMFLTRSARLAGYHVLPGFIAQASGARVTDVDGRNYIDFNAANGPNLLGYRHPEIEAAAQAQGELGDMMPHFSPPMIELCERLLQWNDAFDWAIPVKRGSDATELALRIARARSRRSGVLMVERSYHGTNKELALMHEGIPDDVWSHVTRVKWNDAASVDVIPQELGEQIAAVMICPLDQDAARACVFPTPEFMAAIDRFRQRTGAYIILDDVRSGFRIHPKGSHKAMGIEVDMICLGKPLGNGYAVAAVMGIETLRSGAEQILYASTYLFGAIGYQAAIATLDVYERDNAFAKMERSGQRLVDGLHKAAKRYGQVINISGPVTNPTILYENDPAGALMESFCAEAAQRGALFHPRINWFVSAAHDDGVIDEALEIADQAFAVVAGS